MWIVFQLGFLLWHIRIVFRIGVETENKIQLQLCYIFFLKCFMFDLLIEADGFLAFDIVPPVAGEFLLIEYGAICA